MVDLRGAVGGAIPQPAAEVKALEPAPKEDTAGGNNRLEPAKNRSSVNQ